MPQDTIIVISIITIAFAIFAGVLYWADRQTRDLSH